MSCAVCGQPCIFVSASGDPDEAPSKFGGWYCAPCDAFTETADKLINRVFPRQEGNVARPADVPAGALRKIAANAIRTFCQSLGANVVTVSSDGVERIYYSGLSLDALAVAVALALSAREG